MITRFLKVMCLLAFLVPFTVLDKSTALGAGKSYLLPIAYIGKDGVYVTDAAGDKPTRVISSGDPTKGTHYYSRPQWSPDGQHLVVSDTVVQQDGTTSITLIGVSSNGQSQQLTQAAITPSSTVLPVAWTWDGKQIATFNSQGVFLLPAAGGDPKLLYAPQIVSEIGEANGPEDPAVGLAANEHQVEALRPGYALLSTSVGLLIGSQLQKPDNGGVDNWGVVSPDGKLLWSDLFSTTPVVSPDGTQAIAGYAGSNLDGQQAPPQPGAEPVVLVDLKTGKVSIPPQNFPPGAVPMGWQKTYNLVYFGTITPMGSLDGDQAVAATQKLFDQYSWPFTATVTELSMYTVPVDPFPVQPSSHFSDGGGYAFGVMTLSGDLHAPIVFTYISDSMALVKAINQGSTGEAVTALYPAAKMVAFDSVPMQNTTEHAIKWNRDGSRPSYGTGTFLAVAAK